MAEAQAIANKTPGEEKRSPWVFPSDNPRTHADPRNFYRRVYLPAVKELGLDGVSWHTLRHTFASRLAMSGATEGTIAALLRHSGTSLVRRYAHLSPSHLQHEVEKVAAFGRVVCRVSDQAPPSNAEEVLDHDQRQGMKPCTDLTPTASTLP